MVYPPLALRKLDTLPNSEDPDEMWHNSAFHQGLHCLLRLKQHSGTEMHHNLEASTCDPLKYTKGSLILIASISMEIDQNTNKRVNGCQTPIELCHVNSNNVAFSGW